MFRNKILVVYFDQQTALHDPFTKLVKSLMKNITIKKLEHSATQK